MIPLYGTTMYGTELVLDLWVEDKKIEACNLLIMFIRINKPETINNDIQQAKDTIKKYIEDNFN
jgi:hypothetical protein